MHEKEEEKVDEMVEKGNNDESLLSIYKEIESNYHCNMTASFYARTFIHRQRTKHNE